MAIETAIWHYWCHFRSRNGACFNLLLFSPNLLLSPLNLLLFHQIAKWLENGEKSGHVTKVIHPGLPSHPQHELAKVQMKGFSGMLSFVIDGGIAEATVFLQSLRVSWDIVQPGPHSLSR